MRKLLSCILVLLILGVSVGIQAQNLQQYVFTFTGKWNNAENPLLLDEFGLQDIQNLRKDGKRFKGVSGHTAINTTAPTTASTGYNYILNGFHFKKDQPQESHVIVFATDTATPTAGHLFQNTAAIPGTGNFSTTVLHTPTSFTNPWRFSSAPAGNMVAANGNETLIWGGTELEATAVITSSAAVTYELTNSNDYSDILSNTRQTDDQIATFAVDGGYVKLLLHGDGADGSTTITDSSAGSPVVTSAGSAELDTDQKKYGTASIIFEGTTSYLTSADHADWYFSNGNFTIDFWVRFSSLTDEQVLVSQYEDAANFWSLTKGTAVAGNKLSMRFMDGGVDKGHYVMSGSWSPSVNTWYHLAFVRSGMDGYIFIDGASQTVSEDTAFVLNDVGDMVAALEVGRLGAGGGQNYVSGWIDEVRISKTAWWVANFTPNTQPWGNNSNYFLIGSKRPLQGVKFYVSSGNTTASTMTVKEWQGSSWTTLSVTDTTDTGPTLAQTGTITWTYTGEAKPRYINGLSLYWYQFYFNMGQASVYYVTTDAPIQIIRNVWDGLEGYATKVLKYDTSTYHDYTDAVGDDSQSTYADMDSFANTHSLYLGFIEPQQAFDITFVSGHENANNTVLSVAYWGGSAWTNVTALNDGTNSGTVSFSKGGVVSFQPIEKGMEYPRTISDEYPLYYYRIMFSANLDADVQVAEINGIAAPANMSSYNFSETFQNRLFLFNEPSGLKNMATYSNYNAPDIFNGDDAGILFVGDKTELTAAKTVYNVFQNTAVEQMIITKAHETWRLSGNSPSSWELKRMSANVGCVAPLSMVSAEVTQTSTDVKRSVAIWVSDKGPVMSDGAAIYPIYGDVAAYWDPNSSLYIPTTWQSKSVGWYDPATQSYKLLIASGSSSTFLNTELEYSLKHNEWTKIYRENAAGANPLQSGWQVHDTNGLGYTYGGGKDGFMYRLENGNDWNGVADIAQYIHTKDMILDNERPLFRKSLIKYIRTAYKQKAAATGNLTITHYGDRTATTTGVSGQVTPSAITSVPTSYYNTQSCNLGPFLYHSFKFAQTTDVADGLELTAFGVYYDPQTKITQ